MNIKYKLFSITTALLVALALLIYGMLYFLLPKYYHRYKIEALQDSVKQAVAAAEGEDISRFEEDLYRMSKEQNLAILLRDRDGNIIYGKNEVVFLKYSKYLINNLNSEYRMSTEVNIKEMDESCVLDIIMPLQPINEANKVLRNLVPFTIFAAIMIGILGAYIYSNTITKPLIEMIEKERREEENRREFIATISHELKTPISAILMSLQLLEDKRVGSLNTEQEELSQSIKENSERLLNITGELLNMTQVESGKLQIKPKITKPIELIEYALKANRVQAEKFGIQIEVEYPEDKISKLFVDSEKIAWVLTNLLSNAIRYSPEYSRVIIGAKQKDEKHIELYVKDFGKGIDARYHDSIFEPYFRVPGTKVQGSGLGLSISRDFVEAHGGKLTIESEIGRGSKFSLTLAV